MSRAGQAIELGAGDYWRPLMIRLLLFHARLTCTIILMVDSVVRERVMCVIFRDFSAFFGIFFF